MKSLRHGIVLTLMVMLSVLDACRPGPAPTPPLTPVLMTPSAVPTWGQRPMATPTPTPTVTPLPSPTATPTPVPVWRLAFEGAPCSEMSDDCAPFDDTPTYHYSINSDGTGLEKVEEEALPFTFRPPLRPQLSPDGSLLAIVPGEGRLDIRDVASGKTRVRLSIRYGIQKLNIQVEGGETRSIDLPSSWVSDFFGPFCWTPDGSAVRFVVRAAKDSTHLSIFYAIDRNGENLRLLYVFTDGLINWGDCSPDNREMAFSTGLGLYIINLDSGEWRKVLADYHITVIRTWPIEDRP